MVIATCLIRDKRVLQLLINFDAVVLVQLWLDVVHKAQHVRNHLKPEDKILFLTAPEGG